jgi:hypothetical protein
MAKSRADPRFGYRALSRVALAACPRDPGLALTLVWTLNGAVAADEELRKDLEATVEARRELGPEFESELVASFLDRVEHDLDDRLDEISKAQLADSHRKDNSVPIAIASLALGIPISGAAGGTGGVPGLLAAWSGIAIINIVYAWSHRRSR